VEAAGNQMHLAAAQGNAAAPDGMHRQTLALFERVGCRAGRLRPQVSYAQFLSRQGEVEQAAELERSARGESEAIGLYLFE
jgi:hypothetical protein